jgi:hypothetical protein
MLARADNAVTASRMSFGGLVWHPYRETGLQRSGALFDFHILSTSVDPFTEGEFSAITSAMEAWREIQESQRRREEGLRQDSVRRLNKSMRAARTHVAGGNRPAESGTAIRALALVAGGDSVDGKMAQMNKVEQDFPCRDGLRWTSGAGPQAGGSEMEWQTEWQVDRQLATGRTSKVEQLPCLDGFQFAGSGWQTVADPGMEASEWRNGRQLADGWTRQDGTGSGELGTLPKVLHDLGVLRPLDGTELDGSMLDSASSGGDSNGTRLSGFSTASLFSDPASGPRRLPRRRRPRRLRRAPPLSPPTPAVRCARRWASPTAALLGRLRGWAPVWLAGERLRPPA